MGKTGYLAEIWGYWKPETHTITNNDLCPTIINRVIDSASPINAQSYACEPIVKKLVSSLLPIEGEVFYGPLIKLMVQQGFTITKLGRVLRFKQEPFLLPFIDKVVGLRRKSKSVVEKDFFKRVVNSFYGRLLMNKRGFTDGHLVTDKDLYNKLKRTNRILESEKISDDMVYVGLLPKTVVLDNPIACGCVVPAIGQFICFRHYYRMKSLYGDKLRNIQFDTDSFHNILYEEDLYADIVKSQQEKEELISKFGKMSHEVLDRDFLCDEYDRSNFPKNHPCYNDKMVKWFEKLNFEYAEQYIRMMSSPETKVYVDVPEKWLAEFRMKGVPKFIRDSLLEASDFEFIVLQGLKGDAVIPSTFLYNEFKCVPHTHDMIIHSTEKAVPKFLNLKVYMPDNYTEGIDYQTLALGHKDNGKMIKLTEKWEEWKKTLKEHGIKNPYIK
jgi:hypothetical protein